MKYPALRSRELRDRIVVVQRRVRRAANADISHRNARAALGRPSHADPAGDKPPAATEPPGSHCRGESATTPPLDFPSKDGDVGEFANVGMGENYGSPQRRVTGAWCSSARGVCESAPECGAGGASAHSVRYGTRIVHLARPVQCLAFLVRDAGGGGPHAEYARRFNRAVRTKHERTGARPGSPTANSTHGEGNPTAASASHPRILILFINYLERRLPCRQCYNAEARSLP